MEEAIKHVGRVFDLFRDVSDPSRISIYVLTLVFLRYFANSGTNGTGSTAKAGSAEDPWRHQDDLDLDVRINSTLRSIEEKNDQQLYGISSIDFTNGLDLGEKSQRVKRLSLAVDLLSQAEAALGADNFRQQSLTRDLWMKTLNASSRAGVGSGRPPSTSPSLTSLIAHIASPQDGASVCDPFAGSGSLLKDVAYVYKHRKYEFYGQEMSYREHLVCRMNLFVHGVADSRIELGNTLRSPKLLDSDSLMKFDLIVSNPPFGLKNWSRDPLSDQWDRYKWGTPPTANGDWAVISHILTTLNYQGRAVIVVPDGVLFRRGPEGRIRQRVIEANLIDSVVYLPEGILSATSVPAALLVLSKKKPDDLITFVDGRNGPGISHGRHTDALAIDEIVAALHDGISDKISMHRASINEVSERHFDLSARHYLEQPDRTENMDVSLLWKRLRHIESELTNTWGELVDAVKALE